jgi:gem associated protein 7
MLRVFCLWLKFVFEVNIILIFVSGKGCEFRMFDNTNVTAEFRGCDVDVMHFCVKQLKTPLGILPEAVLRTSDIIRMHLPNIDDLGTQYT